MSVHRRASLIVLWMVAAALVFASAGSSGVAARAAPIYTATIKLGPEPTCTNVASCVHFDFNFINTGNLTYTGILIQINGSNTVTQFSLAGQPACDATGTKFGPNFAHSWECFPKIPPGRTITGWGTAKSPLARGATFRVDWSPNGTPTRGFPTDASQDVPLSSTVTPPKRKWLEAARYEVQEAISAEEAAGGYGGLIHLPNAETDVQRAAKNSEIDNTTELAIGSHIDTAKADDAKANKAHLRDDVNSAKVWDAKARAEKETALHIIDVALNKP